MQRMNDSSANSENPAKKLLLGHSKKSWQPLMALALNLDIQAINKETDKFISFDIYWPIISVVVVYSLIMAKSAFKDLNKKCQLDKWPTKSILDTHTRLKFYKTVKIQNQETTAAALCQQKEQFFIV